MADDWRFQEGERFRQTVIRQAILLGFEAEEYEVSHTQTHVRPSGVTTSVVTVHPRWRFMFDGIRRDAYASLYAAALEYLRLSGFPMNKVGRVNRA